MFMGEQCRYQGKRSHSNHMNLLSQAFWEAITIRAPHVSMQWSCDANKAQRPQGLCMQRGLNKCDCTTYTVYSLQEMAAVSFAPILSCLCSVYFYTTESVLFFLCNPSQHKGKRNPVFAATCTSRAQIFLR